MTAAVSPSPSSSCRGAGSCSRSGCCGAGARRPWPGPAEPGHPPSRPRSSPGTLPADLTARDGRLVLLQFSSAFCRSCRDTHGVLDDVAAELPGLVHRDVDLATRPELVRLLGLHRTPTTLLVDGRGRELLRVSGVPRRAALVSAIEPHLHRRD